MGKGEGWDELFSKRNVEGFAMEIQTLSVDFIGDRSL